MKRSKDCGCSHETHERKGNMPRKMKKPMRKTAGGAVVKSKNLSGGASAGAGGKVTR